MSERDDGGSAFPFAERNGDGSHHHSHPGMSLRDWFAGQALAGLCAIHTGVPQEILAHWAYDQADEMLRVRGER